ncbi:hypothetical protein XELAEV_18025119mg [Xenopus laevis]|uniref:Leptin receptor n=1 Tax=Xenopus laevis TaxID=8355 RepID=A0A974HLI9_XENLA|nr:hypothetical protein XELAEV_18025119mg [Xenopus laevis]
MQITAAYSEMYWTPPSDFFLTCILANKSVSYPLFSGILQNKSDISGKHDISEDRSELRCTYLPDLKSQEHVLCCLWDNSNTNISNFTWNVQCSSGEKTNTLICDLQLLQETQHIINDYQISLHYAL